jgi:hypothetical protein
VSRNQVLRENKAGRGISETSMSEEKQSQGLVITDNIIRGEINAPGAQVYGNNQI